jgi:hypothetical protein
MTEHEPDRSTDALRARPAAGLRLRLWLACLGGALVAAGGIWWVIGTQTGPGPNVDLALIVSWLGAIAGLALIVSAAFALWLDRGIVIHARGLTEAVASREISQLRGLPGASGWGELSLLTQQIQQLLSSYRHGERGAEELGILRDQLLGVRQSLEQWTAEERWVELRAEAGPAAGLVETLNRGLKRWEEVREQNLEAARQVAGELERALDAARESAEQAERGFVEATALLTTVRELQRLSQELGKTVVGQATVAPAEIQAMIAATAKEAIESLVEGSALAVDRLSQGLRKVEAIAEQVPRLANRATLIALDSSTGGGMLSRPEQAEETRRLVTEIRDAVERSATLSRELEAEVAAASSEMQSVRARVAARLDEIQIPATPSRSVEDVSRLLDRVREMIQDATRKGERLSATGERASRAAEGLMRALETDAREMSGLIARLAPTAAGTSAGAEPEAESSRAAGLRLLSQEPRTPERDDLRRSPGAEEPR